MIQIIKKIDENMWQVLEEVQDESLLTQRLLDLRQDGGEYKAEKRDGSMSSILDV